MNLRMICALTCSILLLSCGKSKAIPTIEGFGPGSDSQCILLPGSLLSPCTGRNFCRPDSIHRNVDEHASDRKYQSRQELLAGFDGNFYEPAFHISGDGIGVFAVAGVDTANFEVLRP